MARPGKKGKREEDPPPKGAPEWITTFVDMISLLVTFFILLLTFSDMEQRIVVQVQTILRSSAGIWQDQDADLIRETPPEDFRNPVDPLEGAADQHSRPPEELVENLEEMGQKKTPDQVPIDLSTAQDGLRIAWGDDEAFAPGSAELKPSLVKSLGELGRVLEHYSFLVVVEGHTDDRVTQTPSLDDVGLSLARARAAASVLLSESGLDARMVQVAGLGAQRPRADNGSAIGRHRNRRVEVRILSLSVLRAAAVDRGEEQDGEAGR